MNHVLAAITLLTAAAVAILVPNLGLTFPLRDAVQPVSVCLVLSAVGFYYHRRGVPGFALCMKGVVALVAFSSVFAMLTYCIAATGRPLADSTLVGLDRSLGLSSADVIAWTNARPLVAQAMKLIYFSIITQTILLILFFGLKADKRRVDQFLVRFMVCGLITAGSFYFVPAKGTCEGHGLDVPAHYANIVEHLDGMRGGSRTVVTWRDAEGLITFPSFHAIWAVLITTAFWRTWLCYPVALLNALVVASTITTGMHYFSDVLGGLAVTLIVLGFRVGTMRDECPARHASPAASVPAPLSGP